MRMLRFGRYMLSEWGDCDQMVGWGVSGLEVVGVKKSSRGFRGWVLGQYAAV